MNPIYVGWLPLVMLVAAATARAQEPAAVRRCLLPSHDSQVAARLMALDRRLNVAHTDTLVASLIGELAAAPLNAFTPILADPHNNEIWEELPDDFARLMQESGDALVTLPDGALPRGVGWSSGQVRRLCHQRLASLPRSSLQLYRKRIDAEARALFEQGRQARSPALLRKLVDEMLCSTPGDQALDLLGDLAFEQGRFDEARHWWRLLAPRAGECLRFPQPKVDVARVHAKQILAWIFQGRLDEAQEAITQLQIAYPRAKGSFAGRDDFYAATLQRTLDAFVKDQPHAADPWTTFGGDPMRNGTLAPGLSWQLWEDGPAWRVALPTLHKNNALPPRGPATRRTAFHPVIINDQVLIADHRSVVSYDLATGKELFYYRSKAPGLVDLAPGVDAKARLPRFTLSADHERAYVRLGKLGVGPESVPSSVLVCLDITEPTVDKKRELWQVRAEDRTFFEGAPLVQDGRVHVALSRIVAGRVATSIVCYDRLGRRRWATEVCDCPEFENGAPGIRYGQHLLTWAAGQIVHVSHTGAIVAVDAWSGQPTWAVRYPSRGPLAADGEPSPRDLAPAIYGDGRVFAAPSDSEHVFCIDAATGRLLWELDGVEVVHLLGVANGQLIAATRDGLMSVDAASGRIDGMQPTAGRLPSLGRGLLAGNWLLWPTQDPKQAYRAVSLHKRNDLPIFDPSMLSTLPVGNLAFGQGCLAIAGLDDLVVYVPAHKAKRLPPADVRPEARALEFRRLFSE